MKNRWLTFLSIGFLTIVTFVFFFIRTQPIKLPTIDDALSTETIAKPMITFVNPAKGPTNVPITIITYGDFQCGPCADMAASVEAVRAAYPEQVRVVWKNFPNESLHPEATSTAVAAHCADRQGKFWEFHDLLFQRQSVLSTDTSTQIATELGLDEQRFADCTSSQDTLAVVQKDFEEARALGLSATPATYLNDEVIIGFVDVGELMKKLTPYLSP